MRHASLISEARMGSGRTPTLMVVSDVDKSVSDARNRYRQYVSKSLTIVHGGFVGGPDPQVLGYRDAADECPHGALPSDRVVACTCWDAMELAA